MANHSAHWSKHATAAAGVKDTITLEGPWQRAEVRNRSAVDLVVSMDPDVDPVALANNTDTIGPGETIVVEFTRGTSRKVYLKATAEAAYSIVGFNP